ncbi:hypothetical protein LMG28727_02136 [Paraburkholderia kirstenboschensis]|uniref:hypothetical protein n=1 Tax=Paraburkholderia kirstenboschensis TaxID=1245436 RepID=UPI000ABA95C8|nr:hypothetical protein [Paraburkholderia kirstenboschensis]CAD6526223.1 hypothetical protein LMG28727_02136 [Paraburkholderia kirstenboschensis]
MFDSGMERTIIGSAIVLWFAHGWCLNTLLRDVHRKLDLILVNVGGLRAYRYENDPQFDDERELPRALGESLEEGTVSFAGMNHAELIKRGRQRPADARHSPSRLNHRKTGK